MKKLLIFMLVLGMASLANAALQISVGGDPNPVDSTIWLGVSDTIIIDVWTDAEINTNVGGGYFVLGVDPAYGTLSGGVSLWPAEEGIVYYSGAGGTYLPSPEQGDLLAIGTFLPVGSGITGTIFDSIIFHCEAEGDAVIHLYSDAFGTPTLVDTVIIHQIPEPMTVLLLGLGGLFLRRRRERS